MPGLESIEEPFPEEIAGLVPLPVLHDIRQELPFILKDPCEIV